MNSPEAIKRMKELHHDIFTRGIASRLTPEMFGDEFKNNKILPECFDMGDDGEEISFIYEEMAAEIKRLEERGYTDCILAEIMKARRLAELHKVSTFVELALDMYEQGKSVSIFVNFTETLDAIVSRLIKKVGAAIVAKICGGQKEADRDTEIARFQNDSARFIVCNIQAGGVGVSLHDLNGFFPRCSLISPTWSAVQFVQATGRIHRQGGMTDCLQYVVFCAGTIEEKVCYNLKGKLGAMDILNDGDLKLTGYGLEGIEYEEAA
jgi:SNF2 family DNA or RNA helicase